MSTWWANFHFLRPELLWLLPFAFIPAAVLRYRRQIDNTWDSLLPAEFLQALVPAYKGNNKRPVYWRWLLILLLAIIALAGPSWSKQKSPLIFQQQPLVIVFDLSLSMLATDLLPNRLTRARQKVHDLIGLRKEGQTGLVVFAGTGHVVSPITEDIATLRAFLPALDPFIMPQLGSNVASGVAKATTLLKQSGAPSGRILLMADGLEQGDIDRIAALLAGTPYQLSLIGLGTADGGPIPVPRQGFLKENNEIVVAKPNYAAMRTLTNKTNGLFSPLTIDNLDLQSVLPEQPSIYQPVMGGSANQQGDGSGDELTTRSEQWHDSGYWLLLAIIPMVLWQYRQAGAILLLALIVFPETAKALDWQDAWKTQDQQAMEAYNSGYYEGAATLFEDPLWSGTAHYKAGQYEQALTAFAQENTAISHFNRGNTLVELQRFEEALKAYESALDLNPELTAAEENKRKLSQWLEQQKQAQEKNQENQQQGKDEEKPGKNSGNKSKQQENGGQQTKENPSDLANQSSQENPSASNQGNDKPSPSKPSGQRQNEPTSPSQSQQQQRNDSNDSNDNSANTAEKDNSKQTQFASGKEDTEDPLAQNTPAEKNLDGTDANSRSVDANNSTEGKLTSLKDQQTEQWLRRIPDDPGGLLRRKFLQQYQNHGSRDSRLDTDESRSLW